MSRILSVEDDEAIRGLIKHALSQSGFEVSEAASGQEAFDILRREAEFDLAILDLMLGGETSGWDVYEELNRLGVRDRTKVIIMTARSQEAEILKGWRLGVDQYITKPFDLDVFIATVQDTLLSSKAQLAQHREQELRRTELLHMVDTVFNE